MRLFLISTFFAALPAVYCHSDQHILGLTNSDQEETPPKVIMEGRQKPQLQSATVILSDVLPRDKSISIFASLARQVVDVEQRLDDGSRNTTVLAPLNSAVEALPRKPWEDPPEGDGGGDGKDGEEGGAIRDQKYAGQDGFERAQRNLQRFVEAHMIPSSPWKEGEKCSSVAEKDGQREVWWEEKDGKRIIFPGEIEVVEISGSVANGELWIVKGVRNYA